MVTPTTFAGISQNIFDSEGNRLMPFGPINDIAVNGFEIAGSFFGPSAQEVGGRWRLTGVEDPENPPFSLLASGAFRATQNENSIFVLDQNYVRPPFSQDPFGNRDELISEDPFLWRGNSILYSDTSSTLTHLSNTNIIVDEENNVIPSEINGGAVVTEAVSSCLLYTSPSPRDRTRSRMPSSA